MDFYEALASGTSAEELERVFRKDLAAAQEKIKKEKEAAAAEARMREAAAKLKANKAEEERNRKIQEQRELVAEEFTAYICLLFEDIFKEEDGEVPDSMVEDLYNAIEEKIVEFESTMLPMIKFTSNLKEAFGFSQEEKEETPDYIIQNFLKSL